MRLIAFSVTTENVYTKTWFAMVTLNAWITPMKRTVTALLLSLFVRLENVLIKINYVTPKRTAGTILTNPDVVGRGCFKNRTFSRIFFNSFSGYYVE